MPDNDLNRLHDLRVKGSNRTPDENKEYDELVDSVNSENNAFQGGGENMSTQGQAQLPGQQAGVQPTPGAEQTNTPGNTGATDNANVGETTVNPNQPGTEPGNQPSDQESNG